MTTRTESGQTTTPGDGRPAAPGAFPGWIIVTAPTGERRVVSRSALRAAVVIAR